MTEFAYPLEAGESASGIQIPRWEPTPDRPARRLVSKYASPLCYHLRVLCPSCAEELVEGRCPRCGEVVQPARPRGLPKPTLDTISFSVATQSTSDSPELADWRDELKQKLQKHHLKKRGDLLSEEAEIKTRGANAERLPPSSHQEPSTSAASEAGKRERPDKPLTAAGLPNSKLNDQVSRPETEADRGEVVKQLFKYKLEDPGRLRDRRIITFSKSKASVRPGAEEPLGQKPARRETPRTPHTGPMQRQLTLEPEVEPDPQLQPDHFVPPPAEGLAPIPAPGARPVSVVETLFSRLLAGIIDTVLAGALGLGFAWLASYLSGAPFPSVDSLVVAAGCGWVLLVLNEAFFLFTMRRTPGMLWTELRIESDSEKPLGFQAILIRSLLWLPVAVTLVGLLWALIDSRGRCFHDRITGTRIVPITD